MLCEPSVLVERAWQQKPRCLDEVEASPMKVPPDGVNIFNELGCFSIACRCGSNKAKACRASTPRGRHAVPARRRMR